MARKKEKDGVSISAYIDRELVEALDKKRGNKSRSEAIGDAIQAYVEHGDIVKEFEELSKKYAMLLLKCENKEKGESKEQSFVDRLRKVIKEGMTWKEAMSQLGYTKPEDIVRLMHEHTEMPKYSKNVRIIKDLDDYVLMNNGKATTEIEFIFKKKLRKHR